MVKKSEYHQIVKTWIISLSASKIIVKKHKLVKNNLVVFAIFGEQEMFKICISRDWSIEDENIDILK